MLFEEAVMLAETVRRTPTWRLLALEYVGGEVYTLRVRHDITGMSYLVEDHLVWDSLRTVTERSLHGLEK